LIAHSQREGRSDELVVAGIGAVLCRRQLIYSRISRRYARPSHRRRQSRWPRADDGESD